MRRETPVYVPGYGEMTAGQVAEMVVSTENRVITTGEAAEMFGYSSETWRRWAPKIPGAYQDEGQNGYWRLPYPAALHHVRSINSNRRRKRGPWKATSPSPRGAGAESVPPWSVLRGGHAPVGRREADDAEPEGPRLAG